MIVFILVVTMWQADVQYSTGPPQQVEMFQTIEGAAIKAYEVHRGATMFSRYGCKLYKATLGDSLCIKEIDIPKVTVGGQPE